MHSCPEIMHLSCRCQIVRGGVSGGGGLGGDRGNAQAHHDRCGEVGSIHVKQARRTSAFLHCHFKSTITLPNPTARCRRKTVRLSPSFVAPPPLLLPSSFLLTVMNEATPLICRDSTTFYKHTHTKFRSFTSVSFYKIYAYFIYKLSRDQGRHTCRGLSDEPWPTARFRPNAAPTRMQAFTGGVEISRSLLQLRSWKLDSSCRPSVCWEITPGKGCGGRKPGFSGTPLAPYEMTKRRKFSQS